MKALEVLVLSFIILTCTSCSALIQYVYPEIPSIRLLTPPIFDLVSKEDLECLDYDIRIKFWMFYRRVGTYIKQLHRVVELHNKKAFEENIKNRKPEEVSQRGKKK